MARSNRTLLVIAFAAFIAFGMNDPVLGTSWPFIRVELGRPIGDLGVVVAFGVVGFAGAAALAGSLSKRIGTGGSMLVAYGLALIGVVTFSSASTWAQMLIGSLVLGAAAGLIDPAFNTWMARNHDIRMMNLLHTSFAVGATLAPLIAVGLIDRFDSWRWAYVGLGGWAVVMLVVVALTRTRWGGPVERGQVAAGTDRTAAVWLLLATFMVTAGIEITTGQWAFSVLRDGRGMTDTAAAGFTSSFWGGLAVVRFVGVFIGHRSPKPVILRWSTAALTSGLAWFAVDLGGWGAFGLPLAGAGSALIFPLLITVCAEQFESSADQVIGWAFTGAAAGGVTFPWVAGQFAERVGFAAVAPFLVAAAVVQLFLTRRVLPDPDRSPAPEPAP